MNRRYRKKQLNRSTVSMSAKGGGASAAREKSPASVQEEEEEEERKRPAKRAKIATVRMGKGKRVSTTKGKLWQIMSEAQQKSLPALTKRSKLMYGKITGRCTTTTTLPIRRSLRFLHLIVENLHQYFGPGPLLTRHMLPSW